MKLVFLGPPGAGKGTQAKIISKKLDILHISTGDIFRENMKNKTELGIKAKKIVDAGNLVPDNITNAMVEQRVMEMDCENGYILDGYPRTIPQAKFFDTIQNLDNVINFELAEKEIVKRLSGRRTCNNCGAMFHVYTKKPKKENVCDKCQGKLVQRDDQKPEVIKHRIKVYKELTEPLIKYYTKKELIINVDASGSIESISRNVLKKLQE